MIKKKQSFYFSSGQPRILFLNVKEQFMPSFKNFEKNLEGATRGQSFVWEVYGIFWFNLPPLIFDLLTFILYCIFFTTVASGCYLYKSTIFSNK